MIGNKWNMFRPNQGSSAPFMYVQSTDPMASHNRSSVAGHLRENNTEGRHQSIDSVLEVHEQFRPSLDITTCGASFNDHLRQNGVFRSKFSSYIYPLVFSYGLLLNN